jgi:hypothetical protein
MFRRKPAPERIGGGRRFAEANMRKQKNREHGPLPKERTVLYAINEGQ